MKTKESVLRLQIELLKIYDETCKEFIGRKHILGDLEYGRLKGKCEGIDEAMYYIFNHFNISEEDRLL